MSFRISSKVIIRASRSPASADSSRSLVRSWTDGVDAGPETPPKFENRRLNGCYFVALSGSRRSPRRATYGRWPGCGRENGYGEASRDRQRGARRLRTEQPLCKRRPRSGLARLQAHSVARCVAQRIPLRGIGPVGIRTEGRDGAYLDDRDRRSLAPAAALPPHSMSIGTR